MRVLAVSDVHGRVGRLEKILAAEAAEADLIVAAGDLVRFLDPENLPPVIQALSATRLPVLAVAGNCDGPKVDEFLTKAGLNLRAKGRTVNGVGFCGVAGAPPWSLHTWAVEEDVAAEWIAAGYEEIAGAAVKILVSHAPPAGIVVETPSGASLRLPGSTAVREAVERLAFDAVICGHIHEGQGTGRIGQCLVLCCGAVRDGNYARLEVTAPAEGSVTFPGPGPRVAARRDIKASLRHLPAV